MLKRSDVSKNQDILCQGKLGVLIFFVVGVLISARFFRDNGIDLSAKEKETKEVEKPRGKEK